MAYESHYWRQILKREVRYLDKKLKLTHRETEKNLDKHFSEVEIRIMTLAYIIRKLSDTEKLPDAVLVKSIKLVLYPRITDFSRRSFVDIEREYNLDKQSVSFLTLRELCNQIIHSYILQAVGSSRRTFKYLWFVSDYKRDSGLYQITIAQFLKLVHTVSDSHVSKMTATYDMEKGDWIKKRY